MCYSACPKSKLVCSTSTFLTANNRSFRYVMFPAAVYQLPAGNTSKDFRKSEFQNLQKNSIYTTKNVSAGQFTTQDTFFKTVFTFIFKIKTNKQSHMFYFSITQ